MYRIFLVLLTFISIASCSLQNSGLLYYNATCGNVSSIVTNIIPFSIVPTSTIQFYGDSITAGIGATSSNNRWTSLLSAQLGATEVNNGISATMWTDLGVTMYDTFSPGSTTFLAFGTNDARAQTLFDEISYMITNAILFASIPPSLVYNPRTFGTFHGSWSNTPAYMNQGIFTTAANGANTYNATLTGRFLALGSTVLNTNIYGSATTLQILVNGTAVSGSPWPLYNNLQTSYVGGTYGVFGIFVDLGPLHAGSTFTVKIIPNVIGTPSVPNFFLDWIAAFDKSPVGSNIVIVPDFGTWDIVQTGNSAPNNQGNYETLRIVTKRTCQYIADLTGLPIYYLQGMYDYSSIGMSYDELHPNNFGHAAIARHAYSQLQNPNTP